MTTIEAPKTTPKEVTTAERVVFKYELRQPNETGRVWVRLPSRAVPLSVGLQDGAMVLWALVDPDDHEEALRRLLVVNTGQMICGFPDEPRFLGTLTTRQGIVWHVFGEAAERSRETA